jgi:hypothetical protein
MQRSEKLKIQHIQVHVTIFQKIMNFQLLIINVS